MPFAQNLEYLMMEHRLSNYQLAKDLECHQTSIKNWLSGTKPQRKMLQEIANYFRITENQLTGDELPPIIKREKAPTHIAVGKELGDRIGCISGIPIIASVKAGYNGLAVEDDTGEFVQIPSVMLRGYPSNECRAMRVRGDSMYPKMQDGDIVVVHIQSEVENGRVAVCIVNGDEGTIKRFFRYADHVELWPDNPQVPKMVLKGHLLESFRIYGQAIALIRDDL